MLAFLGFNAQHPTQWAFLTDRHPNLCAVCGRRWGKSRGTVAKEAVSTLFAGQQGWWIAPGVDISAPAVRYMKRFCDRLQKEWGWEYDYKGTPHPTFTTPYGGLWEFRTTGIDPRRANLVGEGLHKIVLDEAGLIPHLVWLLEEQLMPTLNDFNGSITMIGTPRGKNNDYYRYRERILQEGWPDWAIHRYNSLENPYLSEAALQKYIDRATPALVQQEIYAEDIEEFGRFFPTVPFLEPALPLRRQFWGWDYAFGGIAAFVKVVEDAKHRLIAVEEKAGPFPWEKQIEIARQLQGQGAEFVMDPHLEQSSQMHLAREGIRFRQGTNERRSSLEELRAGFNTGICGLSSETAVPYLHKELVEAQIDENDCEDMPKNTPDHAIDAMRYAFFYLWPGTRVFHQAPPRKKGLFEESWERMKGTPA